MVANSAFVVTAALISVVSAQAPQSCCAYGGNGAAIMMGSAVLRVFGGPPSNVDAQLAPVTMGTDGSSFVATLLNTTNPESPDQAVAGWLITQNKTAQTLYIWFNNMVGTTPTCAYGSILKKNGGYVNGFANCPGQPSAIFPGFSSSYMQGASQINWWQQPSGALGAFTEDGCVPTTVLSPNSPLGGGAFSVTFEGGWARVPPSSWGAPPSQCTAWETLQA